MRGQEWDIRWVGGHYFLINWTLIFFFSFAMQERVPINSFTYATSVIDRSLKTFVVEMSNDIRFVTNLYAAFYLINK